MAHASRGKEIKSKVISVVLGMGKNIKKMMKGMTTSKNPPSMRRGYPKGYDSSKWGQ